MTGGTTDPGPDDESPGGAADDLNLLLIEEFYKESVARYGIESEQARALFRLLSRG